MNIELSPQQLAGYYQTIDTLKKIVKNGDLVFRNGTDAVSRAARSMNRIDTSFSHCGIIQVENDTVFVYHALGGIYNPDQHLRRDPIDSFATPADHDRIGLYRFEMTELENKKLTDIIHNYYVSKLPFDLFFNFTSDDKMYCSEFVFKSLNQSLGGTLSPYLQKTNGEIVVCPDDLFLNENCRLIRKVDFTR